MPPTVVHDRLANRFHARVEGALCVLDYSLDSCVMTIDHTGVPAAVAGRGIAAALMQAAVAAAIDAGWKLAPACSYAAAWIKRHPEHRDLCA
jgi:predicted GNAT family acetyltransferase